MFTYIFDAISEYGNAMRSHGYKNPIFVVTKDCKEVLGIDPRGLIPDKVWIPCEGLPETMKKIPGIIGTYDGVVLVEAQQEEPLIVPRPTINDIFRVLNDAKAFFRHAMCPDNYHDFDETNPGGKKIDNAWELLMVIRNRLSSLCREYEEHLGKCCSAPDSEKLVAGIREVIDD